LSAYAAGRLQRFLPEPASPRFRSFLRSPWGTAVIWASVLALIFLLLHGALPAWAITQPGVASASLGSIHQPCKYTLRPRTPTQNRRLARAMWVASADEIRTLALDLKRHGRLKEEEMLLQLGVRRFPKNAEFWTLLAEDLENQ